MNKRTRRNIVGETLAVALFSLWSLRRRAGQIVPVAVALLLLVCAAQSIGALRDVSSVLTQQQIARNWRGPYDLLVRPPSAVSQLERSAGWIDPQSVLENYDGISPQQVARIQALPHIAQVTPFANVGWQSINVLVPVKLPTRGVYRISAAWAGQWAGANEVVRYVDVTDLSHLTTEVPLARPVVQYLLARDDTTPVVFSMSIQAMQALVGIPLSQQAALGQVLLEGIPPAAAIRLSLHVERLRGDLSILPACVEHANCWEPQQLHQGTISYQADGVQLLRFSRTRLLAAGQISIAALGDDIQGPLYRVQLSGHWYLQGAVRSMPGIQVIPFSVPERMPLLPNAVHFISLEQACAINAVNCYTGLYMRLAGVEHYNQRSLALLQATAAAIVASTGLHADILDGSSLRTVSISLSPTGSNLTIQSTWRATGVAVQIVQGVNALQQTLLVLCSIVCLLAIGAAGAVVGIGRRKDALLLQQMGWQRHLLLTAFALDALMLCAPGCLLAVGWIALATWLWPGSLSAVAVEMLISMGVLVYCCAHVSVGCSMSEDRQGRPARSLRRRNPSSVYSRGVPLRSPWGWGRAHSWSPWGPRLPWRGLGSPALICATAVTSAIFLLAIEYMLITSFNQVLIVTVLGKQVRAVLGGPQLLLLLIILLAAFLTVSLCTKLRVEGRREELSLLSMVGWERRFVLLRILWDSCWPGLLSGEVGVLLAIGGTALVATLPPLLTVAGLLLCGPLLGILLVSLATLGPAWQEMKRVFIWK